ncbi:MAG: hypothetical protein KDC02_24395, partial [Flavobacteriales bacterium]|nr:hypothetical protein [Flavobacteriales bacterium]
IGEIVLVVVGILIALQINNWNEQRKLNAQEVKLLQTFKNSLESDTASFNAYIYEYWTIHNSIRKLQRHIEADLPYHDSLDFHFLNSTAYWSPRIDQAVFSTVTSSELNLIKNDSLKKSIASYYTFAKSSFDMKIAKYSSIIDHASREIFSTRFDQLWNTNDRAMVVHDYEALKKDKVYNYFLNSLNQQIYWLVEEPLKTGKKKAEELIEFIEAELGGMENR